MSLPRLTHSFAYAGFASLVLLSAADVQAELVLWYERDGSTYLENIGTENMPVAGYTILSEFGDLLAADDDGVKGWKALEDIESQFPGQVEALNATLGDGVHGFGTANPSSSNLSEVTLNVLGAVFEPGERWFIGKPFASVPIDDAGNQKPGYSFFWKPANATHGPGNFIVGPAVPEPSTWLLAALAGLGLCGLRCSRGQAAANRDLLEVAK